MFKVMFLDFLGNECVVLDRHGYNTIDMAKMAMEYYGDILESVYGCKIILVDNVMCVKGQTNGVYYIEKD